eukprot:27537_5
MDFNPLIFGNPIIYQDKVYIFGGTNDIGMTIRTNEILTIDLKTYNYSSISFPSPEYRKTYPITAPTPRATSAYARVGNKFIYLGGAGQGVRLNDFWVFNADSMNWVGSSMSRYPIGRNNPHIAALDDKRIAVFGGEIRVNVIQPIND